jgi:hypothetical protein
MRDLVGYTTIKRNLAQFLENCGEYAADPDVKEVSPLAFWYLVNSQYFSIPAESSRNIPTKLFSTKFSYNIEDLDLHWTDLDRIDEI